MQDRGLSGAVRSVIDIQSRGEVIDLLFGQCPEAINLDALKFHARVPLSSGSLQEDCQTELMRRMKAMNTCDVARSQRLRGGSQQMQAGVTDFISQRIVGGDWFVA